MRLFAIFVMATCLMSGQEAAKVPPAETNGAGKGDVAQVSEPQTPKERALTDGEVWHLKDTMAELTNLDSEYKIGEYNAKRSALLQEQMTVIGPACVSVSVPQDRISYPKPDGGTGSDCGITVPGKDKDGKPILGPDGKPLTGRVWNAVKPVEPAKAK
jgi:hypothetical protein